MWQYLITPQFERSKKRPDELAAALRNLDRHREQLDGRPIRWPNPQRRDHGSRNCCA